MPSATLVPPSEDKPWPTNVFIMLSFATGATDSFAFLAFDGIFTANMTGNTILAGLFSRSGYGHVLAGASIACLSFAAFLYGGFRYLPQRNAPPGSNRKAALPILIGALVMQLLTFATWVLWRTDPRLTQELSMIAISSGAMALQTVAAKRAGADRSISTTFITGTLSTLMEDIAEGKTGERVERLILLVALWIGALAGTALMTIAPPCAPLLPAFVLAAIVGQLALVPSRTSARHTSV